MTEIYTFLEQQEQMGFHIISIIVLVFSVIVLISIVIRLLKTVAARGFFGTGFFGSLFVIVFIIAFNVLLMRAANSEKRDYAEYTKIMQSQSYSVERGKPENLEFYNIYDDEDDEGDDGYAATFEINGRQFDSIDVYGTWDLTKEGVAALKNSDIVEVKYTEDDGVTVILELSICEKEK